MYEVSKEKHKPKLSSTQKDKKILSIEEGGLSYWSHKTHRWIQGKFDKKKVYLFLQKKIYKSLF